MGIAVRILPSDDVAHALAPEKLLSVFTAKASCLKGKPPRRLGAGALNCGSWPTRKKQHSVNHRQLATQELALTVRSSFRATQSSRRRIVP